MDVGKIVFNNFIAPFRDPGALKEKIQVPESSPVPTEDNVAVTFPQEKTGGTPSKKTKAPAGDKGNHQTPQESTTDAAPDPQIKGAPITPKSSMGSVPVVLFQEESLPAVVDDKVDNQKPAESHHHHMPAKIRKDRTDGLIRKIAREKEEYGLKMQPPCSETVRMSLKDQVSAELSLHLPDDYASFLEKTNGLDHDGLVFYGSHPAPIEGHNDRVLDGVIEVNQSRRDIAGLKDYLVLGESEDILYAYRQDAECYVALDSSSTKECRSYSSFREMLSGALSELA